MKKTLLFAAVAMMTVTSLNAQTPQVYPNEAFAGVSPDGKMAVSVLYEKVAIYDFNNDKTYEYAEGYSAGSGNSISNTGIVVGSNMDPSACYWKNGEWHEIASVAGRAMSKADGITPDGTRIVGAVSPGDYDGSFEGLMLTPCYWDVQADGTLSELHSLPYPAKDFAGRTPQYITAVRVSDDGKTIAGQVQDYSGFVCQPIIYRQNADGEWNYELVREDLFHPEGIEVPEDPGEWEGENPMPESYMSEEEQAAYDAAMEAHEKTYPEYPEYKDYMSEEEYAAYEADLEAYYETWEGEQPMLESYMTEDEYAAYNSAIDAYYEALNAYYNNMPQAMDYLSDESKAAYEAALAAYNEWAEKYEAFIDAFNQLAESVPAFVFNNVLMSPDGKTYATTNEVAYFDPMEWTFVSETSPYVFNLENSTYKDYHNENLNLIVSSITNDGTLLAQKTATMEDPTVEAYVLPADADEFVTLYDYFTAANPDLAAWIKENMTHTYTIYGWEYDPDLDDYVEVETSGEVIATGIPFANADMSVVVLGVENFWDYSETGIEAYGYVLPTDYKVATGINASAATTGKAEYYTTDGRKVNAPMKGLNIVKMANGEIKKTIVK